MGPHMVPSVDLVACKELQSCYPVVTQCFLHGQPGATTLETGSEKCTVRRLHANAAESAHTNLDGLAYCTPRWYTGQPMASKLKICTACYCVKQHEVKSNTGENEAIERRGKHKMYKAQHSVLFDGKHFGK